MCICNVFGWFQRIDSTKNFCFSFYYEAWIRYSDHLMCKWQYKYMILNKLWKTYSIACPYAKQNRKVMYVCTKGQSFTSKSIPCFIYLSGFMIPEPWHDKICLWEFSAQTTHNPACAATKASKSLEISAILEILYYLSSEQRRRWSDCADAQADLRLCCSHMT